MSNADKLVALGAYSCAGDLMWKGKVMGQLRNGDLILTADGLSALSMDVTDVVAKEDRPKRARAPKAEPAPELSVDDLLGSDE